MEQLYELNLLDGFTDTGSAVKALRYTVATVRAKGGHVLRVTHGNGEVVHGAEKLPAAVRTQLKRYKREGQIRFFIGGEVLGDDDPTTRYLVDKYPFVREDPAWGTPDPTYTVVCI